jgi:tetratricopeptide (TPR) repeat protein
MDTLLEKDFFKGLFLIHSYDTVLGVTWESTECVGNEEDLDIALYYTKRCLEIGNRNGELERLEPWWQSLLLCAMGNIYAYKGLELHKNLKELDKAIECYVKGLGLTNDSFLLGYLCKGMAYALHGKSLVASEWDWRGDEWFNEQIEWLKKAKHWYVISGNKEKVEDVLHELTRTCAVAGRSEEAERYYNDLLAITKELGKDPEDSLGFLRKCMDAFCKTKRNE